MEDDFMQIYPQRERDRIYYSRRKRRTERRMPGD
jgi:hypothetical protein